MRLENKVAVVTGAQKGIGAAVARVFAREGAKVVLNWFDDEPAAKALAASIETGGGHVTLAQGNVSKAADVAHMFDVAQSLGGVDIVINNAGIFPRVELLGYDRSGLGYRARREPERFLALLASGRARLGCGWSPGLDY